MSRNFELLRQAEKEQEVFQAPVGPIESSPALKSSPDLELLGNEETKKLVQQIFMAPNSGGGVRTVVFSSIAHGEGASWVSARVAEALSVHSGGSVCLVDANLRSPALHRYLGLGLLPGLSDAVLQEGSILDFVHRVPSNNLSLVPCGTRAAEVAAVLGSDRLKTRILELRAEFDHVLIDAPPTGLYSDAMVLGQIADGMILVLGANSTRRDSALKVKENLAAANVRLLGAVLNRRKYPIPEAIYRKI